MSDTPAGAGGGRAAGRVLRDVVASARGGPPTRIVRDDTSDGPPIVDVTLDSREVVPGALFCCIPGDRVDGHAFAATAVAAGATALVVQRELPLDVPQVVSPDSRATTGWLAASFHDHPFDALTTIGVTGTNGKTTTSQMIGAVLRGAGHRVEVLGTLSGNPHHAGGDRPAAPRRVLAQQWRDGRGDGGVVARAGAASGRRRALRSCGVHEPRPRPPRLP